VAKIVQISHHKSTGGPDELLALDDKGRLWRLARHIQGEEFWSPMSLPPIPDEVKPQD
jgi:hypothetical protein